MQLWLPGNLVPPEFLEAAADPSWVVAAHNDAFETAIEQHVLASRYGFPTVPIERHRCTMAMCLAVGLPAKLCAVAEVLELAHRKDPAGERLMRQMSKPRKPRQGEDPAGTYYFDDRERLDRLGGYCVRDCEVLREIYYRLPPLSPDVGYAGNLGRAHEIETVLQAMKALYKRSIASPADETAKAIKFIFIGGGALRPRLEAEASVSELGNVQFHGYQPREQLAATLCAADLHLVILNPKLEEFVVPSKLYAIAAAGRPMIFIGDRSGEVAKIVNEVGCGFTVEPNDVTGLQNRILQFARSPVLCRMMGARARAAFELQWDKDIAVTRWEQLLTMT